MQTFKTKAFSRFAGRERIDDAALCEAVDRARSGSVDADLGGVIKLRIARKGGGRSGGFRTIVLFRRGDLAFFVYGFARSVWRPCAGTSWRRTAGWPTNTGARPGGRRGSAGGRGDTRGEMQ